MESPNAIWVEYLLQLKKDADEKGNKNYANIYAKCLRSIKKYPIPFISAKELVVLDGFGDKICEEVGQLHQQYAAVHNISALVDHYRYCQKVFLLDFRGV
jgi:hypothetical protein